MISADRMKSVRIAPTPSASRGDPRGAAVRVLGLAVPAELLPHLLGALVTEVGAADHQNRRQLERRELAEQQRTGRMNSSLLRNDPIAIRLMIGSSRSAHPVDVSRGHRRVVDDDSGRLDAGPAGSGPMSSSDEADKPDQGRDIVEKGKQTAHRTAARSAPRARSPRTGRRVESVDDSLAAARSSNRRPFGAPRELGRPGPGAGTRVSMIRSLPLAHARNGDTDPPGDAKGPAARTRRASFERATRTGEIPDQLT